MKKKIILLCIILLLMILILFFWIQWRQNASSETMPNSNSISTVAEKGNFDNAEMNIERNIERSIDKVTMTIKNGTLTKKGVTVIVTDNNESPYGCGDEYRIDKKVGDGWEKLIPVYMDIDGTSGYELGQPFSKDRPSIEYPIDWTNMYGELNKGQYRLVKHVYDIDENETKYFWVEFYID